MKETCTGSLVGFSMRNAKPIAGVVEVLESRGFRGDKPKRSSLMSPNCLSAMVNLETGYEPE